MADLGMTFDSSTVAPSEGFDGAPIPNGPQVAAITNSEKTPTKANDGSWYLKCEFTVLDGPYKNRKLWHNLNLQNANPVAVEIAQAELSAICGAVGVGALRNSQDLHDRPMLIQVKVTKDDGYGPGNRITKFSKLEGQVAGSIAPRAAAAPKATTVTTGYTPPKFAQEAAARKTANG